MSNVPAYPKEPNLAKTSSAAYSNPKGHQLPRREPIPAMRGVVAQSGDEPQLEARGGLMLLPLEEMVRSRPLAAVLAAAGLGIILGRLVKR